MNDMGLRPLPTEFIPPPVLGLFTFLTDFDPLKIPMWWLS